MVTEPPTQIDAEVGVMVSVGAGFTVIARVAVAVHPAALVPVTVYVVFAVGETVIGLPEMFPGFHT
jgi:hypothetical protein